ncbi:MAG: beta-lactamase family protein [Clostridia bacterium]|nr:beta-lactamase family protein [Clostridia bacterium]
MDFTELKKFQDWMSDEWRIPGSTAVGYVDGKEVYHHSSGFADVESGCRMQGDELMFMYSITKTFTSLCGLQLIERGKISLDDPVAEYMPEYADIRVRFKEPGGDIIEKAKKTMKIWHLFTMTAGYDYTMNCPPVDALRAPDGSISTRDMARGLAALPLLFEPGDRWCYGLSHDILAALIEVVTGKRFSEYVKENIFEPVGMKNSYFHLPKEELEARMASKYSFNDATEKYEKIPLFNWAVPGECYDSGGAGLISTVPDVALYAATLARGGVTFSGERIIKRETIDLWRTNQLDEERMRWFDWGQLVGYGYGLGVRTHIDPAKSGSSSPIGEFGWSGAAGGLLYVDVDNNAALFYAHHMLNNQEYFTFPRIRNHFFDGLKK